MTPRRARRLAALLALVVVAGATLGAWRTARARREAWWDRVEAICRCDARTRETLQALTRAGGGLPEVARLELAAIRAGCDDLRAATDRRATLDELLRRPLRVAPSASHRRTVRALGASLGQMCGDEHRAFWAELRDRVEAPTPDAQTRPLLPLLREILRVHGAMCARRATLAAPPRPYSLTAAEAAEAARACPTAGP